jgi:hypothetical protein
MEDKRVSKQIWDEISKEDPESTNLAYRCSFPPVAVEYDNADGGIKAEVKLIVEFVVVGVAAADVVGDAAR